MRVMFDPERNAAGLDVISGRESACTVRVVATDEERMIARHTRDCAQGGGLCS